MPSYVVDSSALLRIVAQEPGTEWMQEWWQANLGERKVAPALLHYETGRALQKNRPHAAPGDLAAIHQRLVGSVELEGPGPLRELEWDSQEGLTFYDACYLALARRHGAIVTADRRLAAAARARGVETVLEVPS